MNALKPVFDRAMSGKASVGRISPAEPEVLWAVLNREMRYWKVGFSRGTDPDNPHVLVRAGALALEGNLAGAAVAWFNEAVRLNPDNYRTRAMLVVALLKAARATAAVEEARAILKAGPKDRYVYEVLKKVFIAANLFDIAAAVIENPHWKEP